MKYLFYILIFAFIFFMLLPYLFPEEEGHKVILDKAYQELYFEIGWEDPVRGHLTIKGNCDCKVTIKTHYLPVIIIEKGEINIDELFDWYNPSAKMQIWSKGCTEKSKLDIQFDFI